MSMPVVSPPSSGGDAGDARQGPRGSWFIAFCDNVERLVACRRLPSLAALVFLGGVGGPIADAMQGTELPVWTVLATNSLLLLLWAVFFGWLGAIRDEAGAFSGQAVMRHCSVLWRAFWESYVDLRASEPRVRLASLGAQLLFLGGLLLVVRGVATVVAVILGSHETLVRTWAGLFWAGSALFVLGVVLLTKATVGVRNASPKAAQLAQASLAELPAIIDLNRDSGRQFGDGDPLRATLGALAQWRDRKVRSYDDVYAYQLALERLFRNRVGTLECRRQVWIGRVRAEGIADLVLGRLLSIHVTRGFSAANARHAIDQIRQYQRKWPNKPKLLIVFDASQRDVFENATVATLQSLREETATITVRM